jgi:hypothetical protein
VGRSALIPEKSENGRGHSVAARNIFGWVGRHFNVIITFFIMFVVIAGKEFLC